MYDLLIRHGTVVDGTGAPRFVADVAVRDGKIAAVAPRLEGEAVQVIDATGRMVSPGFIDWHSHSDMTVLRGLDAPNILEQGITLEITGHCGGSVVPLDMDKAAGGGYSADPGQLEAIAAAGGGFDGFVRELKKLALPTHIAAFVGHGNLRAKAMGYRDDPPTEAELGIMKTALREAMEAGALGMSTGLIYPPGSYSTPAELTALAHVLAEYPGAMYTSHMRNEADRVVESVRETLALGREAGIPVVISHHKVGGQHNMGKSVETLALIDQAKAQGQIIHLDAYPYDGGGTSLTSALPPKFATGGPKALIESLHDPAVRAEITALIKAPSTDFENLIYLCGLDRVIAVSQARPDISGKNLLQLGQESGKDPYENLFDLLIETDGAISAIYRAISTWDLENILKYPHTMAGTDGTQKDKMSPYDHPRLGATFPKLIGTYCRDKCFYSLEDCIHRFTGKAAAAAGFAQKGVVAPGKDADLVIFNFDTISGSADYASADLPNEGIEHVFVGGVQAVQDGKITGLKGGKVLLRGGIEA